MLCIGRNTCRFSVDREPDSVEAREMVEDYPEDYSLSTDTSFQEAGTKRCEASEVKFAAWYGKCRKPFVLQAQGP